MDVELNRICQQLRHIAGEAGLLLVTGPSPETVERCVQQYNEVAMQVSGLLPVLRPEVLPLGSSATTVRIAARSLAACIAEHLRRQPKPSNPFFMF